MTTPGPRPTLHWLPNAMTLARIALTPFVMAGIAIGARSNESAWVWGAFIGFVLAAALDYADGALARKLGVESAFGRALDPIADKVLVAGVIIAMIASNRLLGVGVWLGAVIVLRDLSVAGLREHALTIGRALPVTKLAKWKTAFEMLALGALLAVPLFSKGAFLAAQIGSGLLVIAAALSIWTGALYARAGLGKGAT